MFVTKDMCKLDTAGDTESVQTGSLLPVVTQLLGICKANIVDRGG